MSRQSAREGREMIDQKVGYLSRIESAKRDRLVFSGLLNFGGQNRWKCVPDGRALRRCPQADVRPRPPVVVTKVVGQVPGILFCNFRLAEPSDVSASTKFAGVQFKEQIGFSRFEGDAAVLTYKPEVFGYVSQKTLLKGEPTEIRIDQERRYLRIGRVSVLDHHSKKDHWCWRIGMRREAYSCLGGKDSVVKEPFEEIFYITDRAAHERMLQLFSSNEFDG